MEVTTRQNLPARRASETLEFEADGLRYIATIGRYDDGRPGEIFVNAARLDTGVDVAISDAAVAVSIALQYGVPVDVLAHAMKRDATGKPRGPLGHVLDLLAT